MNSPVEYTPLIVDSREADVHPNTLDYLRKQGVPLRFELLDSSDYCFTAPHEIAGRIPTIGIERCTVSDLVGKLDGRLSWQLGNMIKMFDVPYLLIEDNLVADREGYLRVAGRAICDYTRLTDILHGAQAHGVIVICDPNVNERLRRIIAYWHRPCGTHTYFRPNAVVRDVSVPIAQALDMRIIFLMGVPGLGEDRATAALAHFGSLLPLLCAPVEALMEIPGWGPKTARNFRDFIDKMERYNG